MRTLIIVFLSFFLIGNSPSFAKDQVKEVLAKNKYQEKDFRGSLRLYQELLVKEPNNLDYNYHVGECLQSLKYYKEALPYFETVQKAKPNYSKALPLNLGICYHRTAKIDQALKEFEEYKKTLSAKQLKSDDVVQYINQCATAKELMAKPVKAQLENMGELVNSKYEDYAPSVTADGKTIIFTSRRDDTRGGLMDGESDGKYFEDIYSSTFDEATGKWSEAEPLKGSVNTDGHDASLSISPDGNQIFVYRNIPDETRSGDIYMATLNKSGKWNSPKDLGPMINSSYFESSASMSADGKTLYFVSERKLKSAVGNGDIYMVQKIGKNDWGEPVNLGSIVNTEDDEVSVFIHPDGKTLFFSSKGHNSMGGYDIFKTVLDDKGIWSKPENIGYPINTTDDDLHFVMSTDNTTAYYSSNMGPKNIGERDIYKIDVSKSGIMPVVESTDKNNGLNAIAIVKGDIIDTYAAQGIEAEVMIKDVETGKEVIRVTSTTDGSYFATLPANKKYELSVTKEGYKPVIQSVDLSSSGRKGTYTLTKHISLERVN